MVIFDLKEMLGILDLRSIAYCNIKHGDLQQNLSKYYRFELAGIFCDQLNKFKNTLRKEKDETKDNYPWLERRSMTDKDILEKYIDLENHFC